MEEDYKIKNSDPFIIKKTIKLFTFFKLKKIKKYCNSNEETEKEMFNETLFIDEVMEGGDE